MTRNKVVGVLFTSGVDSTYLVYKNLMEGNTVLPYYINLTNNANKCKKELEQIKKLISLFKDDYKEKIANIDLIADVQVNTNGRNDCYALVQPAIWLFGLSWRHGEVDEFQMAYVANDCALSYLDDIKRVHNSYRGLMEKKVKFAPLKFPLIKYTKKEMMYALPDKYAEHVYSCENPDTSYVDPKNPTLESCGYCEPCKKYDKISHYDLRTKFKTIYSYKDRQKAYDDLIKSDDGPALTIDIPKMKFVKEKDLLKVLSSKKECLNSCHDEFGTKLSADDKRRA